MLIVSFVASSVNLKLMMPSTGYLGDLQIMENWVASSLKQHRWKKPFSLPNLAAWLSITLVFRIRAVGIGGVETCLFSSLLSPW